MATWTGQNKSASSWATVSKNSSSWASDTKNSTVWTGLSENTTTWDDNLDFMLKEDVFFLLLETGDKIILEPSEGFRDTAQFVYINKS